MPFKSLDQFDTREKYIIQFKRELGKLDDQLGDFYFFDEAPLGSQKETILLLGDVKTSVVKALKSTSKSRATGKCFMDGKTLKMTVTSGKMPSAKLKPLFSGLSYSYSMIDAIEDGPSQDDRARANAESRLQQTTARFDKVKGKIGDDNRKTLHNEFGKVSDLMEAAEFDGAYKILVDLDKTLVGFVREALSDAQSDAGGRQEKTAELQKAIQRNLDAELEKMTKLQAAVEREEIVLADLQKALKAPMKKRDAERKVGQIKSCEIRLAKVRELLEASKGGLEENIKTLKAQKINVEKPLLAAMANLSQKIKQLDAALDSVPIDIAKAALRDTVRKMAEATEWREDQVKSGSGHGTGRHGAQTGLHRQARRAATSDGITPDQPGNEAGVSMSEDPLTPNTATWEKVKFTYEEKDGKRVMKNRTESSRAIAIAATRKMRSDVGSMWATPVLEKEAVDTAMKHAARLKPYTHYDKGGTQKEFKSLSIVLGKPSSAPGWGYAVEKDGADVDPGDAETLLKRFETGAIDLRKLFSELNVKLLSKDGGATMIPHAIIVLKRASGGAEWALVTHYPNHKLTAANVGWECERNWRPGSVAFIQGTSSKSFQNNRLP